MDELEVRLVMSRQQALDLLTGISAGKQALGEMEGRERELFMDTARLSAAENVMEWAEGKIIAAYNERARR